MPEDLTRQRCFNHSLREAAARCPECGRYFCRECVTEHDERVLCAQCLAQRGKEGRTGVLRQGMAVRGVQLAFSVLVLWFLFYLLGKSLLLLPSAFHKGTLWHVN